MSIADLNQSELETLRILWEKGELKPAEIQKAFSWPIENPTLRSVLVTLVDKGHIVRTRQGKAFHYSAAVPKATMLQAMMRGVARVFSGGSTRELVAQLVETGDIAPSDVKLLQQFAQSPKTKRNAR